MKKPKQGWLRTWPDCPEDGVFWIDGNRMGRVYRYCDGRWRWCSWSHPVGQGLTETREAAMAAVEARADLETLDATCRVDYVRSVYPKA